MKDTVLESITPRVYGQTGDPIRRTAVVSVGTRCTQVNQILYKITFAIKVNDYLLLK